MTPDKTHKVNLIVQVLITLVPFGGLYAHYRIQKVRLGILVNIVSVAAFIIPVLLLPDYNESLDDQTTIYGIAIGIGIIIWYALPYYFLIKWSIDWNKRIDSELPNSKNGTVEDSLL
jgi:hypothetical protein